MLDSMPTIVNDRTMVPLRFIAESLDKQVGWDNVNRTAIIIDYGYFSNVLKTRAAALYNFLNMNKTYVEFAVTHNYYDLQNAINNTSFTAKMNASVLNNLQNAVLTISGTDELSKEIIAEGWNSTAFSIQYNDKDILVNSQNAKIKEMFKLGANGTTYTYKDLGLNGMPNTSFDELFRIWAGVEDNSLKVNTFSKLKNDFTKLCDIFAPREVRRGMARGRVERRRLHRAQQGAPRGDPLPRAHPRPPPRAPPRRNQRAPRAIAARRARPPPGQSSSGGIGARVSKSAAAPA